MIRTATGHFTEKERFFITPDGTKHEYKEGSGPYEYLMGALAGCFYSTLASMERKGEWKEVSITANGIKRTVVPTTLEHTSLEIVGKGISDKDEFEMLVKKTAEECSIFQTISKVSAMEKLFQPWRLSRKDTRVTLEPWWRCWQSRYFCQSFSEGTPWQITSAVTRFS